LTNVETSVQTLNLVINRHVTQRTLASLLSQKLPLGALNRLRFGALLGSWLWWLVVRVRLEE